MEPIKRVFLVRPMGSTPGSSRSRRERKREFMGSMGSTYFNFQSFQTLKVEPMGGTHVIVNGFHGFHLPTPNPLFRFSVPFSRISEHF